MSRASRVFAGGFGRSLKRVATVIMVSLLTMLARADAHGANDARIDDVTRAIAAHPDDATLQLDRGELYRAHRDWALAAADYDRALTLNGALHVVHLARGQMLLEADRPEEAVTSLQHYLRWVPGDPEALRSLARAHAAAAESHSRAAIVSFTELAARQESTGPEDVLLHARVVAGLGADHLVDALQGLDQALARLGAIPTLQAAAVELEVQRGAIDNALRRLDEIMAHFPRNERWLLRKGEVLENAGRDVEARAAYSAGLIELEKVPESRRRSDLVKAIEEAIRAGIARLANAEPAQ